MADLKFEDATLDAVSLLSVRKEMKAEPEAIGAAMAEAFGAVWQAREAAGAPAITPPMAAYVSMAEGVATADIGMGVAPGDAGKFPSDGDLRVVELPAGAAIRVIHKGPYAKLGETYKAAFAHVAMSGKTPGFPIRESYLNDPQETPESDWLTQIDVPVS
ncbi:MAG: GyrI-like domain-containing protein [Pseudomonadota bacterium]